MAPQHGSLPLRLRRRRRRARTRWPSATRSSTTTAASCGATTKSSRTTPTVSPSSASARTRSRGCFAPPATKGSLRRPHGARSSVTSSSATSRTPSTADFRPDLPGLETVTVNFWGNQGIVHFFDADGQRLPRVRAGAAWQHDAARELDGAAGAEYWLLSPNPTEGGLFDGWGRRVCASPRTAIPTWPRPCSTSRATAGTSSSSGTLRSSGSTPRRQPEVRAALQAGAQPALQYVELPGHGLTAGLVGVVPLRVECAP